MSRTRSILVPDSLTDSLAPEAVALSARRLGIAAGLTALVHLIYVVLYQTVWEAIGSPLGLQMALVGLFISLATSAYQDAHRRGLIHRDIKPANLFVSRKGGTVDFLKVLDFGLVKRSGVLDEKMSSAPGDSMLHTKQTNADKIIGTPAFMPPEAILGDQVVDQRADIYALGCVAYWMLTGELIFSDGTTVGMLTAHVAKQPEPPSARAGLPIAAELERVVLDCLHKDRDQRPASAEALRGALTSISLAEPWSRERAAAWWAQHMPALQTP